MEALTSKLREGLSHYTAQIAALKEEHAILREELDRLRAGNASCISQATCSQVKGLNSESGPASPGAAASAGPQAQSGARCVDALRLCLAAGNCSRFRNLYSSHDCHHGPHAPALAMSEQKKGAEEHLCCLHRIAIPNKFVLPPQTDFGDLPKPSTEVEAEVGNLITPKLKTGETFINKAKC